MTDVRSLLGTTVAHVRRTELTFLAAAIAYYAFVSLVPAVLLALAVGSAVGGEGVAAAVLGGVDRFLTPAGESAVAAAITAGAGRSSATIVGVIGLAWSGLKVFRGLDRSFSRVYGTHEPEPLVGQLRDALLVTVAIGVGTAGMVGLGVALALLRLPTGGAVVGLLGLLAGLTVVFLPMYYVFPDAEVALRETLPGAGLAAVGWVLLQSLFQLYASVAGGFALYGVLGGILLLVTWFYAAAVLLLTGAVLNAVLAGRTPEPTGTKTPATGAPDDPDGRRRGG